MKKLLIYLVISSVYVSSLPAQCFQTTMTNTGNTLIFKIKPTVADIATGFTAMEFFVRYPSDKVLTWGTVTPNTTDFPMLQLSKQAPSLIATESGSTIVRVFQTLLTSTTSATYTNGVEYEVFRITATGTATNVELVHLDDYFKYWSTMTALDAATERTCPIKFYGTGATATAASFQSLNLTSLVLPLELTQFSGKQVGDANKLEWQTANEQNMSHFVVEKSADAADKFQNIGEVKAKGNTRTPQYYSLFDAEPSLLNYYRLKMMDNDGQFKYSKTITLANREGNKGGVELYPNPVTNILNIALKNKHYHTATVNVSDITGKILISQSKNGDTATGLPFVLDMYAFQNGVYSVVVTIDGISALHKIVVAR